MLTLVGWVVGGMVTSIYVVASPQVIIAMVGGGPPHPSQKYLVKNVDLLDGWVVCG